MTKQNVRAPEPLLEFCGPYQSEISKRYTLKMYGTKQVRFGGRLRSGTGIEPLDLKKMMRNFDPIIREKR